MSAFKPMSEDALQEIAGNCATETSVLARVVATALHHLASAKTALAERDAVTVERDEAYKQRDEAKALLNAFPRLDEWASLRSQIEDARAILGAAPDELLSDAARRAVSGPPMTVLNEVRAVLGVPPAESVVTKAKWIMEARAKSHEMQNEREAEIDRLRARVAELESAEAEPLQVFRTAISVTVRHIVGGSGLTYAEIDVSDVVDPAFLALSGHQLARLGLVVCDG